MASVETNISIVIETAAKVKNPHRNNTLNFSSNENKT
jgi:hypothetical protein